MKTVVLMKGDQIISNAMAKESPVCRPPAGFSGQALVRLSMHSLANATLTFMIPDGVSVHAVSWGRCV